MATEHVTSDVGLFVQLPEWVLYLPGLSDRAFRLLAVLRRHEGEGGAYPSRARMARLMGCSRDKVDAALLDLQQQRLVTVIERWKLADGRVVEAPERPDSSAQRTSNRYQLHLLRQPTSEPEPLEGVGAESPPPSRETPPTWGHGAPEGGGVEATRIEIPLNERSFPRLVPRSHGANAQAVQQLVVAGEAEQRVLEPLRRIYELVSPGNLMPRHVQASLETWAELLRPEDAERLEAEIRREHAGRGWRFASGFIARIAGARRAGSADPWATEAERPRKQSVRRAGSLPTNAMVAKPGQRDAVQGVVVVGFVDGRAVRKRDVERGHFDDGTPVPAELLPGGGP